MSQTIDLYLITTLSNLHAGRGDSNYGIVDNEVQRDPIQEYPIIFSSSLKGALRELLDRDLSIDREDIVAIFGNEVNNNGTIRPGRYIFHEAHLLSLPVRSEKRPFYHGTTPEILQELGEMLQILQPSSKELIESLKSLTSADVEQQKPQAEEPGALDEFSAMGFKPNIKPSLTEVYKKSLLQSPLALFHTADFKSICERLPIIARNQLEDGVSKNLFYEEVVPRQTRFTLFIERPTDNDNLYEHLKARNFRVQIGANASIGYGVCTLQRISL